MAVEVSSAEIARNFAEYRERAEAEAVTVLHYNKPSVVMVSASEYDRLKRRDRQVLVIEDMPEEIAERIIGARMDPKYDYLNDVKA